MTATRHNHETQFDSGNGIRPLTVGLASDLLDTGNDLRVRVTGNSMKPFLRNGDIATIRKVPVSALKAGDIVFCHYGYEMMILHRLLTIRKKGAANDAPVLYTKGDAANKVDTPFTPAQCLGKAVCIERDGRRGIVQMDLLSRKTIIINHVRACYHRFRAGVFSAGGITISESPQTNNRRYRDYVLSLMSDQPALPPGDWEGFVRYLTNEHLHGLVYRLIKDEKTVPANVKSYSEKAYYWTFAANTVRIEHLKEIEQRLASEGICALLLKGAALLGKIYDDPGTRPMEDIDLLVRPEALSAVKRILGHCGFEADSRFPGMFSNNGVLIDVHTSLMHTGRINARSALFPMDLKRIFEYAVPWQPGFIGLRTPDEATHLIYMAHHMIKHSFSKLIWLADFFQNVRERDPLFWKNFENRVNRYRQQKPLAYVFFLLEGMFCFAPPAWTAFHRPGDRMSKFESSLLKLKLRGHSLGDLGILLWVGCLPSLRAKLGLLKETMFPLRAVLRRENPSIGGLKTSELISHRCRSIIRQARLNLNVFVHAVRMK